MSKIPLPSLFKVNRCKSDSLESYAIGNTPFISSTTLNNGVEKMAELVNKEHLINNVPCIAISEFGFATVQTKPFYWCW